MIYPPEFPPNKGNPALHMSASAVNLARISTFKGLEADVVFVLDTHKMAEGDYKTAYAQGSRARVWLGVFWKNV